MLFLNKNIRDAVLSRKVHMLQLWNAAYQENIRDAACFINRRMPHVTLLNISYQEKYTFYQSVIKCGVGKFVISFAL